MKPLSIQRTLSADSSSRLPNKQGSGTAAPGSKPFFGRRLLPGLRRTKSQGAERRVSEFNIIGSQGIVSSEYTLEKIVQAKKELFITKLELEDVVKRSENTTEVFAAIAELLSEETARPWQYIKFIDSVRVTQCDRKEDVGLLLEHYSVKRQQLCDQIAPYAAGKPIMFQLKVEVAEDTTLTSLLLLLRHLNDMHLARIEFGGALFATRRDGIAEKLVRLCRKNYRSSLLGNSSRYEEDEEDGVEDENPYLHEMIMFSLSFAGIDSATEGNQTITQFLAGCIDQLENFSTSTKTSAPLMEDFSANSTTSSIGASSGRRARRRPTPKRKQKNLVTRVSSTKASLDNDESMRAVDMIVEEDPSSGNSNNDSKSSNMSSSSKRRGPGTTKRSLSTDSTCKKTLENHSYHSYQQRKGRDSGKGIPKCQIRRCKSTDDGTLPDYDWSMRLSSKSTINSIDKSSSSSAVVPDSRDDSIKTKPPDFRWDKD